MRDPSSSALLLFIALSAACTGGQGGVTDTASDTGDSDSAAGASSGTGDSDSTAGASSGTGDSDSTAGSGTGADSNTGAASDSDPAPTGGEEESCPAPDARDDVDFVFKHDTLPFNEELDLDCVVDGTEVGVEPGVSAGLDLSCIDAADVSHAVRIDLKLFHDATLVLTTGDEVTLSYRTDQGLGEYREWLSLRGQDDTMKLLAARGFEIFTVDAAPLWAPIEFVPVTDVFCLAEEIEACHVQRRVGLDITLGGATQRLFDRSWAAFASGLTVHLGAARMVNLYPNPGCVGDAPDGLEIRMIVVGEK